MIGISDISASESKLWRFTALSHCIKAEERLSSRDLIDLSRQCISVQNENVIRRHLALLEKFELVVRIDQSLVLSGSGKALCQLTSNSSRELSLIEKIFYFVSLFESPAAVQLISLLKTLKELEPASRKDAIENFFRGEVASQVWRRGLIIKNLEKLRASGTVPSFFNNKFGCLVGWLLDLGLVQHSKRVLSLQARAREILAGLFDSVPIGKGLYEIAGELYVQSPRRFELDESKDFFLHNLKKTCSLFHSDSELCDFRSAMKYLCCKFLFEGTIMEEETFVATVSKLVSSGAIRSVMLGRDGQPIALVLGKFR